MTTYGGISASFPSVFDPATGAPQGPVHWAPGQDTWLGAGVSAEQDADKLPDADTWTNIDPATNAANRDGGDDGVVFPISLPQCQLSQFQFTLNITGAVMGRYANAWFDFNRNGQWGDQIQCVDPVTQQTVTVNEWAVQNQLTSLGPGIHTVTTPQFRSLDVDASLWMRITVAEAPSPAADGRGVRFGYEIGETEDYLLTNTQGTTYSP